MTKCIFCERDIRAGGDFVKNQDKKLLCKNCVTTAYMIFLENHIKDEMKEQFSNLVSDKRRVMEAKK